LFLDQSPQFNGLKHEFLIFLNNWRLWVDERMGKLRNIFGMNVVTGGVEAETYEGALSMTRKALNNMG